MGSERKVEKRPSPPYLPFSTFKGFVEGLRAGMPSRIDRSLMGTMSGSGQSRVINALQYLGLISENGIPSDTLNGLVTSEGPERQKIFSKVLADGYPFLFVEGFDLRTMTAKHLEDQFSKSGATGDTVRKGVAFFLAAAKEAGIPISPHVAKKPGPKKGSTRPRKSRHTPPKTPAPVPEESETLKTHQLSWEQLLLLKFPSLDPDWSDEVKAKWFDAFDKLMEKGKEIQAE